MSAETKSCLSRDRADIVGARMSQTTACPATPVGYIYLTINKITGRAYIGQRVGKFRLKYKGSGVAIRSAVKKYGASSFWVFPLEFCSTQGELDSAERDHISVYDFYGADLYNISPGGKRAFGHSPSAETRAKISATLTGRKRVWESEEERAEFGIKISRAKSGKKTRSPSYRPKTFGRQHPRTTFDVRLASALLQIGKTRAANPKKRTSGQMIAHFWNKLPPDMKTEENEELVHILFNKRLKNVVH